jgi:photosystem II stability/assembly factor-like uncharacterized protein
MVRNSVPHGKVTLSFLALQGKMALMRREQSVLRATYAALILLLFAPHVKAQETQNPAQAPSNFERGEDESSIVRRREDWFYKQRAYPHEKIPTGAHLRAMQQLDLQLEAEGAHPMVRPMAAPAPAWSFLGPRPISTPYSFPTVSGRVAAIAIDPTNTDVIYAGAAQGGVWKTTNAGAKWTELTDTQASLAVGSIAIDPANHLTIYVGTGEENFSGDSYYGAGILKSTNGGATWTHICGPFCGPTNSSSYWGGGARVGTIAIQPGNSKVLLAGVQWLGQDGVYRSADGGSTWTHVLSGNPGTGVLFDPANGNIAYAALGAAFAGGTEGFYRSVNGGVTWTPSNGSGENSLNLDGAGRIVLAMALSSPSTIYASLEDIDNSGVLGFYKTTNGGTSWTLLASTPNYCTPQCWYDNAIGVNPKNPDEVWAGGAFGTTLVRSLDGGSTWTQLQSAENYGSVHADVHALVFTPNGKQLLVGSDGGVYNTAQSEANTPEFTPLNETLGITQFYPGLAADPANVGVALGGTQDNGSLLYSGSVNWNQVACGDGGYSAIDPAQPSIMYTTCEDIAIYKSTASGSFASWGSVTSGIDTSDRSQFIPPLVMDPARPARLYFGTYRIYQTTNGATSWNAISADLTAGGTITTLAVEPANDNVVFSGSSDSQVYVTTDALKGASAAWTNVTNGLPPRAITEIVAHPTSPTTAYIAFSGFTGFGDSLGHIFKTTDSGEKWTDISGNLPNTPVNSLTVDPDDPGYIFAGTDVGVFYTANGGATWNTLMEDLPRVAVLGLTLNEEPYTLLAATHGRGVWDLNVTTVVPVPTLGSISPLSATAGSKAITLTVKGVNYSSNSVVRWKGVNLVTKFVSSTELTATIPAADLAKAALVPVTVYKPGTPSLTSHAIDFTVKKP